MPVVKMNTNTVPSDSRDELASVGDPSHRNRRSGPAVPGPGEATTSDSERAVGRATPRSGGPSLTASHRRGVAGLRATVGKSRADLVWYLVVAGRN